MVSLAYRCDSALRRAGEKFTLSVRGQDAFSFRLADVRVVGERVRPEPYPASDHFLVVVPTGATTWHEVPVDAVGFDELIDALERRVGDRIRFRLGHEFGPKSTVIWPESVAGQPLIEMTTPPPTGVLSRLRGIVFPTHVPRLTRPVREVSAPEATAGAAR